MEIRTNQTQQSWEGGITKREVVALQDLARVGTLSFDKQKWLERFDFSQEFNERFSAARANRGQSLQDFFDKLLVRTRMKAGLILENHHEKVRGKTMKELAQEGWNMEYLNDVKKELQKSKISDVQVFSLREGGFAIRCKVDGEQQSAVKLSKEDVLSLTDRTDRKELAAKYFGNVMEEDRSRGMKR